MGGPPGVPDPAGYVTPKTEPELRPGLTRHRRLPAELVAQCVRVYIVFREQLRIGVEV